MVKYILFGMVIMFFLNMLPYWATAATIILIAIVTLAFELIHNAGMRKERWNKTHPTACKC